MGLKHSTLVQHEKVQLRKMHPSLSTFLKRDSGNVKLDTEVRRWIVIRVPQLFTVKETRSKTQVSEVLDDLWRPYNLTEIDVFNCIFMRFADLSPLWVFRDIRRLEFFNCYLAVSFNVCL